MSDKAKLAVVLGSGLGSISKSLFQMNVLKTEKKGIHNIRILNGYLENEPVILVTGRKHYYEGYNGNEITAYIDYLKSIGIEYLLLTNAAGGLNSNYRVGDLMLIESFIMFNPGIRHGEKKKINSLSLKNILIRAAQTSKIKLHRGVYACFAGPVYETPSEMRLLSAYNVNAAGMSTVPEIIAAAGMNINTAAVSVITNLLTETNPVRASHEDVVEASKSTIPKLLLIISSLLRELNK
jgi:purine-nucleoside phosphorylase